MSHRAAELLRSYGHDVSTVRLQRLEGAPDEILFYRCIEEGRVLVTLDHDFGEILRFDPSRIAIARLCRTSRAMTE